VAFAFAFASPCFKLWWVTHCWRAALTFIISTWQRSVHGVSWHLKGPARERDRQAFPEFSLDFPPELLAKLQEIEWGKNKYGRGPRLAAERESALHQMLFWLVVVVARLTRFPARRVQKRGFEKRKQRLALWLVRIFFACHSISLFPALLGGCFCHLTKWRSTAGFYFVALSSLWNIRNGSRTSNPFHHPYLSPIFQASAHWKSSKQEARRPRDFQNSAVHIGTVMLEPTPTPVPCIFHFPFSIFRFLCSVSAKLHPFRTYLPALLTFFPDQKKTEFSPLALHNLPFLWLFFRWAFNWQFISGCLSREQRDPESAVGVPETRGVALATLFSFRMMAGGDFQTGFPEGRA